MSSRLALGVIGGSIESAVGRAHKTAVMMDGNFEILAACFSKDADLTKRTAFEWNLGKCKLFSTWHALLENQQEKLDALLVLTPPPSHKEVILEALRFGFPVISEKPLCLSSSEAEEIKRAVDQNGGYLAVIYNYSGYPMVREFRAQIEAGKLGKLLHIRAEMPQEGFIRASYTSRTVPIPQHWRLQDNEIPTVSLDLGVHLLHLITFLTGQNPVSVVGQQNSYGAFPSLIDNVDALVNYSKDISSNIWFGKTSLGYRNGLRVRVFGTKGAAEWYQMEPESLKMIDEFGQVRSLDRSGDVIVASDDRYQRFKTGHPAGFIEALANYYEDIYCELQARKLGAPAENEFTAGVEASLEGLRVLEAISRSNGYPISLDGSEGKA